MSILGVFGTVFDLLLVVLGFSLIIFVHELGHFLAARWAGIRVMAFAIGFGNAAVSYRKGMGWKRGSSERAYAKLAERGQDEGISPTEYRLNTLPFGGYVKMLGQDDLDPAKTSSEPDSYQSCPPWKRMIVISAGVVMNLVSAAILFIAVFMLGLETEPATIGGVSGPSRTAVAVNAEALGVESTGLQPGDDVLEVNGREPNSFNDVYLASAMAKRDKPIELTIERSGFETPLRFEILPERSPVTGLLSIGVEPARSAKIFDESDPKASEVFEQRLAEIGVPGVRPGMRLVRVGDDEEIEGAYELEEAIEASGGEPVEVAFEAENGTRTSGALTPTPELMVGLAKTTDEREAVFEHLLGLTPVMKVGALTEQDRGYELGLREGDVFLSLGAQEYPSIIEGIREIRAHAGRDLRMTVDRDGETVDLIAPVRKDGTVGFAVSDTARESTLLAMTPGTIKPARDGDEAVTPAAASIVTTPGWRVLEVDGRAVSDFGDLRAALREATQVAMDLQQASTQVALTVELPMAPVDGDRVQQIDWGLDRGDIVALHELGWSSPISMAIFEPKQFELKAAGPLEAVTMGVAETNRVMLTTYATFDRLFAGTVKVEHLKGPVGIAHLGTRIADRGLIWLMFFMALISVNLAVINFLPLPIVDGGQFILLVIEQIRGRPVPISVQNAISMAGLVLIGGVFLLVTFNDIKAILGV